MSTLKEGSGYLFYAGATFTVEWYSDPAGQMEAKDYYDKLNSDERGQLLYIVKYFADSPIGTRLPETLYNLEDAENKIYAFKPKDYRFFNFLTLGRRVIIVNAYRKHSQKMDKKDLNLLRKAIEAKESYLRRVEKGVYYERFAE